MVPSMALIFFASSREELALVRLITEPVVPLAILLWEVFSDCALVIPAVVPIRMIDDNTRRDRMFFIINTMATNYLMIQDLELFHDTNRKNPPISSYNMVKIL